jgi:hypothetical protein
MKCTRLFALVICIVLTLLANPAAAATTQTTSFTYQGQLNASGVATSGLYYFTFTLYDSLSGPNVIGTPIQQQLAVGSGGVFTTDLDFGQRFDNTQYWLGIKVGTTAINGQALAARQPINSVPVAQYALNTPPGSFADFFALMPPDNVVTVAVGGTVDFPQDGPASGTGVIFRTGPSSFILTAIGTYQVMFQVSVNEPGQLILALDTGAGAVELPYTVVGRATGTSQIVGMSLITTSVVNTTLSVQNPAGSFSALTITPLAGGTHPVSAHLVITLLR